MCAGSAAPLPPLFSLKSGRGSGTIGSQKRLFSNTEQALAFMNRYRAMAVYAISFDPGPANKAAMQKMAAQNHALYHAVAVD